MTITLKRSSAFQKLRFLSKIRLPKKLPDFVFLLAIILMAALFIWFIIANTPKGPKTTPKTVNIPEGSQSGKSQPGSKNTSNQNNGNESSTSAKCCTDAKTGLFVAGPPLAECMEYEFGKPMRDLSGMLNSLKNVDLVLQGTGDKHEFNGFVSSITGQASLSKYAIYLYSRDTLNYEFNPPYVYKATTCNDDLKQKIIQALEPIKNTL